MSKIQYCTPITSLRALFGRARERFVAREPNKDAEITQEERGSSIYCLKNKRSFYESSMQGETWHELRCLYGNTVNTTTTFFVPMEYNGTSYEMRLAQTVGPETRYDGDEFVPRKNGSYYTPVKYSLSVYVGDHEAATISSEGCSYTLSQALLSREVSPLPPNFDLLKAAAKTIAHGYNDYFPILEVPTKKAGR